MAVATSRRSSRIVVWGGLALGLALAVSVCIAGWRAERALAGDWGLPLDDSWIHCTIARNLVQGHGWSYNPGVPVQNSSGPLWTALVALGFLIAGPEVWVPKALGAACLLGCVVFAWRLGRRWAAGGTRGPAGGVDPTEIWPAIAAATAAILSALSLPLAWHGLSGMETPLAALLVAVTLDAFAAWDSGRKRFAWTAAAALATMTRPETLLLMPLLVVERWRLQRQAATPTPAVASQEAVSRVRTALIGSALCAAFLLPYFLLNLKTTGALFPATFAAKAGDTGLGSALRHLDAKEALVSLTLYPYVWTVHAIAFFAQTNFALLLLAVVGAWSAALGRGGFLAPAVLLVALPALRGAAAPHLTSGAQHGRYIASLLPVYFACAGVGWVAFWRAAWPFVTASRPARLALAGVGALAVLALLRFERRLPADGPSPFAALTSLWPGLASEGWLHYLVRDEVAGLLVLALGAAALLLSSMAPRRTLPFVGCAFAAWAIGLQVSTILGLPRLYARNVRNIQQMDVELGRWVKKTVPPGVTIAVNDIGAIAFFGERPLIDAMGLATPELVPYSTPNRLRELIALRRLRPEMCIFFPNWFPSWMNRPSLFVPVMRHRVDDNTILGGSVAVVYRANWQRFDRYYDDALLEKLDPVERYDSWRGHWKRGLVNLHVLSRAELYVEAGNRARIRRDFDAAIRNYRKSIELDAHELGAWTGLLDVLRSQADRDGYGKAVQDMVRAVPTSSDAYDLLGQWQSAAGQVEDARRTFEQGLALHPDNVELLGKLEGYWEYRGDLERSARYRARREELAGRAPADEPASP